MKSAGPWDPQVAGKGLVLAVPTKKEDPCRRVTSGLLRPDTAESRGGGGEGLDSDLRPASSLPVPLYLLATSQAFRWKVD